jgi:hypothetical protein
MTTGSYDLTPKGQVQARKTQQIRDAEDAFLVLMYEHGEPMNLEELIGEANVTDEVGLRTVNRLINKELVKEI